ncbi:MAG: arginase family protein [Alistipes sp.]
MDVKEFNPDAVGVDNGAYFGFPFTPHDAELVLISAPWDVTVSYGAGAANAPRALIDASTQLDFYDPMAPDVWRRGIATVAVDESLRESSRDLRTDAARVIDHLESGGSAADADVVSKIRRVNEGCACMNQKLYAQAQQWLTMGKRVGLVGGDHSTPYGLIRALGEHHAAFGILHVDAHCDLREAYEGFEFSHASIMFNVLRDVPQVQRLVQVGVRDYCAAEAALAAASERIVLFNDQELARAGFAGTSWANQCSKIVDALPQEVYISFDIDGLSVENCPHTGTPVPGGLSFNQAIYLAQCVVCSGRSIIGFDVVEVVPGTKECVDAAVGARVLYKLCLLTLLSKK